MAAVVPGYMYFPAAHSVHADSATEPVSELYLPAEHPVHAVSVLVTDLYCPASQATHVPEDARCPGPHVTASELEHGQTRTLPASPVALAHVEVDPLLP